MNGGWLVWVLHSGRRGSSSREPSPAHRPAAGRRCRCCCSARPPPAAAARAAAPAQHPPSTHPERARPSLAKPTCFLRRLMSRMEMTPTTWFPASLSTTARPVTCATWKQAAGSGAREAAVRAQARQAGDDESAARKPPGAPWQRPQPPASSSSGARLVELGGGRGQRLVGRGKAQLARGHQVRHCGHGGGAAARVSAAGGRRAWQARGGGGRGAGRP